MVQGQAWAGVSLLLRSRCTFACEHLNCASKHTSRAALRSTGPWPPPSRPSSSEQPRAELVAVGWNVPCAKWYAARWNAWNASIDAVEALRRPGGRGGVRGTLSRCEGAGRRQRGQCGSGFNLHGLHPAVDKLLRGRSRRFFDLVVEGGQGGGRRARVVEGGVILRGLGGAERGGAELTSRTTELARRVSRRCCNVQT